jgi:hypothetical protein
MASQWNGRLKSRESLAFSLDGFVEGAPPPYFKGVKIFMAEEMKCGSMFLETGCSSN